MSLEKDAIRATVPTIGFDSFIDDLCRFDVETMHADGHVHMHAADLRVPAGAPQELKKRGQEPAGMTGVPCVSNIDRFREIAATTRES